MPQMATPWGSGGRPAVHGLGVGVVVGCAMATILSGFWGTLGVGGNAKSSQDLAATVMDLHKQLRARDAEIIRLLQRKGCSRGAELVNTPAVAATTTLQNSLATAMISVTL